MSRQLRLTPAWSLQTFGAALAIAALWLWPADGNAVLLVPLLPGSGEHLAAVAREHGANIVRLATPSGRLVVQGDDGFARFMLSRGVLPVNAVAAGCGPRR